MSRGRIIKPELFNSEQIAEAGELALVQLQGLWMEGDENGVYPAQTFALCRATIALFGHQADETRRRIEVLKGALDRSDTARKGEPLVYEYDVAGARFWLVPGFLRQNKKAHRPSYRYPLPTVDASSPEWLKNWARENKEHFENLPVGITRGVRGDYPPPRQEAEAEAEAEADTETEGLTNQPSPVRPARATPEAPPDEGSAGSRDPGNQKAPRPKRSTATQLALERVRGLVGKHEHVALKALDEDAASAIAVRRLGGWHAFEAAMLSDPELTAQAFCREFGKTCAAKKSRDGPKRDAA